MGAELGINVRHLELGGTLTPVGPVGVVTDNSLLPGCTSWFNIARGNKGAIGLVAITVVFAAVIVIVVNLNVDNLFLPFPKADSVNDSTIMRHR